MFGRGRRPVSPGRTDVSVVRRHLGALREALANLRRHSGSTPEMLRADMDLRWTVEHGLQLCARNAINIATHLAATAGLDASDYASAIDRLMGMNVLPAAFGARFRQVAGLRNVLVHDYIEVDLEVVARILDENLDDFEEFARRVERHLDESAAA